MAVNVGQISNPSIFIKPSKQLHKYIQNVKVSDDMPWGIKQFVFKNKIESEPRKPENIKHFISERDLDFIETLELNSRIENVDLKPPPKKPQTESKDKLLTLQDLYWLYDYIKEHDEQKVYLHELFEGSEIVLPKNVEVPRSAELEKRCQKLKAEQQNREYNMMTKNVDNKRRQHPEDTISYQCKII